MITLIGWSINALSLSKVPTLTIDRQFFLDPLWKWKEYVF